MPADGIPHLPRPELLTFDEITDIVSVFARHGVRRVRLTGGEPLVRAQLSTLVSHLVAVEGIEEVVMTTNAFLLGRHAEALWEAGLRGLNISFDSTRPDVFERITRGGKIDRVVAGIQAARDAGFRQLKLNAVIMGGQNDDELFELISFAQQHDAVMRFIEFMPIGQDMGWGRATCVPAATIRRRLAERWDLQAETANGDVRGPARYWTARGPGLPPDGARFGIISAVSECFCSDCNRVRLSPRGGLRACLADDREVSLRDALRTAPSREKGLSIVEELVAQALFGKRESHAFDLDGAGVTDTSMTAIGG